MKRLIRNATLDLKYGAFLGGIVKTPYAHLGIEDTASTDYAALPEIFGDRIGPADVLVDIGCGKGRVINWWLSRGLGNQIIGIELDQKVADDTRCRLESHSNVRVICGDALDRLPENGTIFYLFNPFNETWVDAFKGKVVTFRKPITILYYNCLHLGVFKDDRRWMVREIELRRPFHPLAIIQPAPHADVFRGFSGCKHFLPIADQENG